MSLFIAFSSVIILFINSCSTFNLDFLCFLGSAAGSRVGILSKFFYGNNLLLKLLRTFSLSLNNNPKFFKKYLFLSHFISLSKFFDSLAKLFCFLSAFSIDKCPSCISLKKTKGSEYLLTLSAF